MGQSTFTSNVRGNVGINVASLTATLIAGGTSFSVPITTVTSYIKLGNRFIFSGSEANSASIAAEATALVGPVAKAGSLYLEESGACWVFINSYTASPLIY